MTDAKRDALRVLQDRWLRIGTVQAQIRNYGLDHAIGGVGTPSFRRVQDCVLPDWETFFRGFFEE